LLSRLIEISSSSGETGAEMECADSVVTGEVFVSLCSSSFLLRITSSNSFKDLSMFSLGLLRDLMLPMLPMLPILLLISREVKKDSLLFSVGFWLLIRF
jgi:hypothetical protein